DSPLAAMKNFGPREGGAVRAAQFIQRFVENGVKWAHVDMAGKAWTDKPGSTYDKGATGFGVRLLDEYVSDVLEAAARARGRAISIGSPERRRSRSSESSRRRCSLRADGC